MKEFLNDIKIVLLSIFRYVKEISVSCYHFIYRFIKEVYKWIGHDGMLNLETCALLVPVFGIWFSEILSAVIVLLMAIAKCDYDSRNGSDKEFHDFLCCIVGIVIGMILIYLL